MKPEIYSALEEELIELAGPLGKFVLKKHLKEMGSTPDDYPEEKMKELIKAIVPKAVFDESLHRTAVKALTQKMTAATPE